MANTLKLGNGKWATGKDTVLAFNDENNNFKPLPFSFSRDTSGTVVNKDGLIETVGVGEPRIDFKDNTKGALLLEPNRTNLIVNSEDFEGSGWTDFNVTLNSSQSSPNGNSNAYLIEPTNSSFLLYAQSSVIASTEYTFSYFFKSGTKDAVKIAFYDDTANSFIETNATQSFVDYGNGWKRIITSVTTPLGCTSLYSYIDRSSDVGTFYAWGAQLEQGSYATSYIPTSGSAVTRVAESTSQTVPDGVIGQTEGTIFVDVDFDFETLSGTNMFVSIRPDASNKIEIYRSDAIIYGEFSSNASFDFNKQSVTVGRYKIAVAYSSGSSAMYINGVLIGSNTTPFAFTSTLDDVYINSRGTSFLEQSNYNDVKLYNTRLSNNELQALTTI